MEGVCDSGYSPVEEGDTGAWMGRARVSEERTNDLRKTSEMDGSASFQEKRTRLNLVSSSLSKLILHSFPFRYVLYVRFTSIEPIKDAGSCYFILAISDILSVDKEETSKPRFIM